MSKKEDKSSEKEESQQDLETLFDLYARFGDQESDGTITLKNIDKWMKQADLLDEKGICLVHADTARNFSKIMKDKKRMDLNEFQEFIKSLANEKKAEPQEFIDKLIATGEPNVSSAIQMTNPKLHTGAHKERSDEEGKGKGKDGRNVSGYKKDEKDDKVEKGDKDEKDDKDKGKNKKK